MHLIKSALREMKTTDRVLATHFSKVLHSLKLSVGHIQSTVNQTMYINTKTGQPVKAEHATAIDQLTKLLDKATPQAPARSVRLTQDDALVLLDEHAKKAILAGQP